MISSLNNNKINHISRVSNKATHCMAIMEAQNNIDRFLNVENVSGELLSIVIMDSSVLYTRDFYYQTKKIKRPIFRTFLYQIKKNFRTLTFFSYHSNNYGKIHRDLLLYGWVWFYGLNPYGLWTLRT